MFLATIQSDVVHHCESRWVELLFAGLFIVAVLFDLFLLWTGRGSISMRIWIQNHKHPTLIGLEVLIGVGVCYLLRHSWPSVMIAGALIIGHLAVTNEYRPESEDGKNG